MFRECLYNPSRHQRVEVVLSSSVSPMAQAVSGETSVCSKQLHFFPPSSFVKILLHSSIYLPFKKNYIKPLKLEVWCATAHLEKTTTEISTAREGMEPAVISHRSLAMASPVPAQGHWLLQELQATSSTTEKPTPSPGRTGGTPLIPSCSSSSNPSTSECWLPEGQGLSRGSRT